MDLQGAGDAGYRLPLCAGHFHASDHCQWPDGSSPPGILIKGGVYLEEGRKLKWLALDKTGTLTHGKPVQTDAIIYTGVAEDEGRSLAVSTAGYSDHPVSQAVSAASDGIQRYEVENFEALPAAACAASSTVKPTVWAI